MCETIGCCCICCCGDTGESCRKTIGREKTTKLCYLFIVLVFTIPAILIMFLLNNWDAFKTHFSWMTCPSSSGAGYLSPNSVSSSALAHRPSSGWVSVSCASSGWCSCSCFAGVDLRCASMRVSSASSTSASWAFLSHCFSHRMKVFSHMLMWVSTYRSHSCSCR